MRDPTKNFNSNRKEYTKSFNFDDPATVPKDQFYYGIIGLKKSNRETEDSMLMAKKKRSDQF